MFGELVWGLVQGLVREGGGLVWEVGLVGWFGRLVGWVVFFWEERGWELVWSGSGAEREGVGGELGGRGTDHPPTHALMVWGLGGGGCLEGWRQGGSGAGRWFGSVGELVAYELLPGR